MISVLLIVQKHNPICRNPTGKCYLPRAPDYCHVQIVSVRFYYDQEEQQCKVFDYDVCESGTNIFETFGECYESCIRKPTPEGQNLIGYERKFLK